MAETPNHGYNVPSEGAQNWHVPLNENFEQYDTDIEIRDAAGNRGDYQPKDGAKFLATDTGMVFVGDGNEWVPSFISPEYDPADSGSVTLSIDGARVLSLGGESGGDAGNVLAGHSSNSVDSDVLGATIAGGGLDDGNSVLTNVVYDNYGTISGGVDNQAGSDDGDSTTATTATVGGGRGNQASGAEATVGGGGSNEATGEESTVGSGILNEAIGKDSTVGGGYDNVASGEHATIPGGNSNEAQSAYSFAAGRGATAAAAGAFVWGDSSDQNVTSNQTNEFKVQAGGGAILYSSSDLSQGVNLAPGDGSWSSVSTRTAKTNISPTEPEAVLESVEDLEVSTWEYDSAQDATHMGPMAEEFHDAFGLGADRECIANVDADGVALAAIQGLSKRIERRDERIETQAERIDELSARNEALSAENDRLRERLDALEDRVADIEAERTEPATTTD